MLNGNVVPPSPEAWIRVLIFAPVPEIAVVSTVNWCEPTISTRDIDAEVAVDVIAALAISAILTAHPRTVHAPCPFAHIATAVP